MVVVVVVVVEVFVVVVVVVYEDVHYVPILWNKCLHGLLKITRTLFRSFETKANIGKKTSCGLF